MGFAVGETVGPYKILEHIGQGGMATIYKARHLTLDRDVALKVIHPALKEDPSFQTRLNREASIVAQLHHPGIVTIYDFGESEGIAYIVMRYIQGTTLKAVLQARRLKPEEVLRIARLIGDALSFAHQHGVLHRDVKPSNILIDDEGQVFLTDFGLARLVTSAESTLTRDMLIGSPHYISPEQAKGERADERSDIYSFGVVIYEMFTGRVPFAGETPYTTILAHINEPPPPARSLDPAISLAVEKVLDKALEKDPASRYPSIDQLLTDLEQAVHCDGYSSELPSDSVGAVGPVSMSDQTQNSTRNVDVPLRVMPATPMGSSNASPETQESNRPDPLSRGQTAEEASTGKAIDHVPEDQTFLSRLAPVWQSVGLEIPRSMSSTINALRNSNRLAWLGAAILALCFLTAAVWGAVANRSQPTRVAIAFITETPAFEAINIEFPTTTATPMPLSTFIVPTARPTATTIRPPTSLIGPVAGNSGTAPETPRGKVAYTVANGDLPELRSIWIANSDGTDAHPIVEMAMWPAISPDGRQIAYYRVKDSGIYIANSDGSNPRKAIALADTCCVQWSPDSKRLVFFRGNLKFGGTIATAKLDGTELREITEGYNPSWAPDGNRITYARCQTNSSQCGLFVVDIRTKASTMITRDNGANPQWSPRGDKIVYQADDGKGHVNVFSVSPDGSGVRQLTAGKGNDGQPVWSRDGNFIFWRSDQNGSGWGIFVMRADGTHARRLIPSVPPDPDKWGRESLTTGP